MAPPTKLTRNTPEKSEEHSYWWKNYTWHGRSAYVCVAVLPGWAVEQYLGVPLNLGPSVMGPIMIICPLKHANLYLVYKNMLYRSHKCEKSPTDKHTFITVKFIRQITTILMLLSLNGNLSYFRILKSGQYRHILSKPELIPVTKSLYILVIWTDWKEWWAIS